MYDIQKCLFIEAICRPLFTKYAHPKPLYPFQNNEFCYTERILSNYDNMFCDEMNTFYHSKKLVLQIKCNTVKPLNSRHLPV